MSDYIACDILKGVPTIVVTDGEQAFLFTDQFGGDDSINFPPMVKASIAARLRVLADLIEFGPDKD